MLKLIQPTPREEIATCLSKVLQERRDLGQQGNTCELHGRPFKKHELLMILQM